MSLAHGLKARAAKPEVTGPLVALFIAVVFLGLVLLAAPPTLVGIFVALTGAPGWLTFLLTVAAALVWGAILARYTKRKR